MVLVTGIPDVNCLAAQFESSAYGDYNKFTHLNFFTRESIAALAQKEGFATQFLLDEDPDPTLIWNFVYDECLPYITNGTWCVFGRKLPHKMNVRDVFSDDALLYNLYATCPQDGQRMKIHFKRYKSYERHKDHINLLFKKFFIDTTSQKFSPDMLQVALEDLKDNLFDTLLLDTPHGLSSHDKERLLMVNDAESIPIKKEFQNIYQISLRSLWCYLIKKP